jgi:hypothetical protein
VGDNQSVEMIDDAGTVLAQIDGVVMAKWIDANTYATADCASGGYIGQVTIHRLDGTLTLLDGQYDSSALIGSGHGAVALSIRSAESPQGRPSFTVWASGRFSRAITGEPVAWSPDGSRLLIRADTAWGTPAAPEILSYPSLTVATSFPGVLLGPIDTPVFSPDGDHIAASCGMSHTAYYCASMVLDGATGASRAVTPTQAEGLPMSWLSNGHLLLQPENQPAAGPFREWDGARVVPSKLPAGSWAVASPGGRLVAIGASTDASSGSTLVVTATGAPVAQLSATDGGYLGVTWSEDGTHLAVWDDAQQELDLLRVASS